MWFHLRFRLLARKEGALRKAPAILSKHLRSGFGAIAKRLISSARVRMRKDRGDQGKALQYKIEGRGLNINLVVFSTLIQSFVDAYGLKRGVFPNFRVNSDLFNWAKRKLHGIKSKRVRTGAVPKGKFKRRRVKSPKRVKHRSSKGVPITKRAKAKNTDARRLAFLAARAIYLRGIRPTYWNRKALDANKTRITRELQNAMSRAANEIKRG